MEENNPIQETTPNRYSQQPTPEQPVKQKGFLLPIIGVVLLLVIVGAGAYYLETTKSLNKPVTESIKPTSSIQVTSTQDETANWITYTNTKFGYSYKIPLVGYEVKGNEGDANLFQATPTANGTAVVPSGGDNENRIFSTLFIGKDFTEDAIKFRFGPQTRLTINSVLIDGMSSYKVVMESAYEPDGTFVKEPLKYTWYYVKTNTNQVIEIKVLNNSADAEKILSTFVFAGQSQTNSSGLSSEGQSCGKNAGPAGDAHCAPGLVCKYATVQEESSGIGTCVKE